ncbi:Uncharacterised protein [Mycobacteroides abscessus subsp. abscessus]|nr:Uncharacterised protein [Mycobacteroides abscessus subsp. abscessus]
MNLVPRDVVLELGQSGEWVAAGEAADWQDRAMGCQLIGRGGIGPNRRRHPGEPAGIVFEILREVRGRLLLL